DDARDKAPVRQQPEAVLPLRQIVAAARAEDRCAGVGVEVDETAGGKLLTVVGEVLAPALNCQSQQFFRPATFSLCRLITDDTIGKVADVLVTALGRNLANRLASLINDCRRTFAQQPRRRVRKVDRSDGGGAVDDPEGRLAG